MLWRITILSVFSGENIRQQSIEEVENLIEMTNVFWIKICHLPDNTVVIIEPFRYVMKLVFVDVIVPENISLLQFQVIWCLRPNLSFCYAFGVGKKFYCISFCLIVSSKRNSFAYLIYMKKDLSFFPYVS